MSKSLHYLLTRLTTLICLVALFAVGTTASAERFQFDLRKAGAHEFRDGSVVMTSNVDASHDGIAISKTQNRLHFTVPDSFDKGIGRIVFTPTPGTHISNVKNFAQMATENTCYTVMSDGKLVYTPHFVSRDITLDAYMRLLWANSEFTIESVEIYTGYTTMLPTSTEFSDLSEEYTDVIQFTSGVGISSDPASGSWRRGTASSRQRKSVLYEEYLTFSESSFAIQNQCADPLLEYTSTNIYVGGDFSISAPAGYAIKAVRFSGKSLEGISATGFTRGTMSGNLDRFWTSDGTIADLDKATFTYQPVYNEDEEEEGAAVAEISRLTITYVSLGSKEDKRFYVEPEQCFPDIYDECVVDEVSRSFSTYVRPAAGQTFTGVLDSFIGIMTLADGSISTVRVNGNLDADGNALFNVTVPNSFDINKPTKATLRIQDNTIFGENDTYNRRFDQEVKICNGQYGLAVVGSSLLVGFPLVNNDYPENIPFTEDWAYDTESVDHIRIAFNNYSFDSNGGWNDYPLEWSYGEEPSTIAFFLKNEDTQERIRVSSFEFEGGQLRLDLEHPLTPVPYGRYSLAIRKGVITANGKRNNEELLGFTLCKKVGEDDVKVSPVNDAYLTELSSFKVSSNIGGTFQLIKDKATVEYDSPQGKKYVEASVSLENNCVVYTLPKTLVAGVDVFTDGPSILLALENVYTLNGLCGGVPGYLQYNFVNNISTERYDYVEPVENALVSVNDIYSGKELEEGKHGFFVSFPYPITDAAGNALKHGDLLWPDGNNQPEGVIFSENGDDLGGPTFVYVYNDGHDHGLLVWLDRVEAGEYNLVIPQGSFHMGGSVVNAYTDITWKLIETMAESSCEIAYPKTGSFYTSLDKVVVGRRWDNIKSVSTDVYVDIFDFTTKIASSKHATGSLVDGKAVFTFDEPITTDSEHEIKITVRPGAIYDETGFTNYELWNAIFVNPNTNLVEPNYVGPQAGSITIDDLRNQWRNDAYGFVIGFPEDVRQLNEGTLLYGSNIGYPYGYSFTFTSPEGDEQDYSDRGDIFIQEGNSSRIVINPHCDDQAGTYHLQIPAGVFPLASGAVNAPIDITWNVIATVYEQEIALSPSFEEGRQPIDVFTLSAVPGTALAFTNVLQSETNVSVRCDGNEYEIPATVSVKNGVAYLQLAEAFEGRVRPQITIPAGIVCDQYGRVTPSIRQTYSMDSFDLGQANVSQDDALKELSEFHITVPNGVKVLSIPEDYAINFIVGNDWQTYQDQKGCVSVASNESGESVITVTLPAALQQYISSQSHETMLQATLPGYDPTGYADKDNCIRSKGGLPNRSEVYYFSIDPALSYMAHFSVIDMPEDLTVYYDGKALPADNVNLKGIFLEELDEPFSIDLLSIVTPDNKEYTVRDITNRGVFTEGEIDFARYASIVIYPFANDTVSQDDLPPGSPISFIFDREIDGIYDGNDNRWLATYTNEQGDNIEIGWMSGSSVWYGLGTTDWGGVLPAGTYHFTFPSRIFRFTDGSWNPEIDYTFTVTEPTSFNFNGYAAGDFDARQYFNVFGENGNPTRPFPAMMVYLDSSAYKEIIGASTEVFDSKHPVSVLTSEGYVTMMAQFADAHEPMNDHYGFSIQLYDTNDEPVYLQAPFAQVIIPEGLFTTGSGLTNKEYSMWFNILGEDYKTINIYVNGQLNNDLPIIYTYNSGGRYEARSGDMVCMGDGMQLLGLDGEGFSLYQWDKTGSGTTGTTADVYNFYFYFNPERHFLTAYDINGNGSLRTATLTFDKGADTDNSALDPAVIRQRIEWSEGFEIGRGVFYLPIAQYNHHIEYVTTSVEGNDVTLHFYDRDGREANNLLPGDYTLTVPMQKLFVRPELWGRDLTGSSLLGKIRLRFKVTPPQVETGNEDATLEEQAETLADIILGKQPNTSSDNDINGDGNLSVGDIVNLIEQNNNSAELPDEGADEFNATVDGQVLTLWEGSKELPSYSESLYIGQDGGEDFVNFGVKAGWIARFFLEPIDPTYEGWLIIHEGHWGSEYASQDNYNPRTKCVTVALTQEMIDAALTQQFWGGIFVLMGENYRLTKVTVTPR